MRVNEALKDLMTETVARLARLVEKSDGEWSMPWKQLGLGLHKNASTLNAYTGGNQFILALYALVQALEEPFWATHKQWKAMGFQVIPNAELPTDENGDPIKKGRTVLVRWLFPVNCEVHGWKWQRCCDKAVGAGPRVKGFTVFHVSQVRAVSDDAVLPTQETPDATFEPRKLRLTVDNWKAAGLVLKEVDSDRAYFNKAQDYINLPPIGAFHGEAGYYSTLLHEMTHWAGHDDRLGRKNHAKVFGDKEYAGEELVAEIGATLLAAALGLEVEPHPEHSDYIKNWLGALQEDPSRLYQAAKEAEQRTTYLLGLADVGEMAA